MAHGKILVYSDATRTEGAEEVRGAYGWVALDLEASSSFIIPSVSEVLLGEAARSTVLNEVRAIVDAARAFPEAQEIHILTDSKFAVDQWAKARAGNPLKIRVCREEIAWLGAQERVHLHHVRAHQGFFFNELADRLVKAVTLGTTVEAAEAQARAVARRGTLELRLSKDLSLRPKFVRRAHPKNAELHASLGVA